MKKLLYNFQYQSFVIIVEKTNNFWNKKTGPRKQKIFFALFQRLDTFFKKMKKQILGQYFEQNNESFRAKTLPH